MAWNFFAEAKTGGAKKFGKIKKILKDWKNMEKIKENWKKLGKICEKL